MKDFFFFLTKKCFKKERKQRAIKTHKANHMEMHLQQPCRLPWEEGFMFKTSL